VSEIIGVVGAGTMGNGIAQVAARAGYAVIMRDVRDEFLQRGLAAIDKSLQRDVDKQRLDAGGKQAIVERIRTTTDLESFAEELRKHDAAPLPRARRWQRSPPSRYPRTEPPRAPLRGAGARDLPPFASCVSA